MGSSCGVPFFLGHAGWLDPGHDGWPLLMMAGVRSCGWSHGEPRPISTEQRRHRKLGDKPDEEWPRPPLQGDHDVGGQDLPDVSVDAGNQEGAMWLGQSAEGGWVGQGHGTSRVQDSIDRLLFFTTTIGASVGTVAWRAQPASQG